jgi:murein DD-endopeptidase MepM/ murein hydrolase activator NlpD
MRTAFSRRTLLRGIAGTALAALTRDAWPDDVDAINATLSGRKLLIPVSGVLARDLHDTFDERRGNVPHEALDILAPRGTPVLAADDGRIVKLLHSVPGGLTINHAADYDDRIVFYYAHLDGYADGLREGAKVARGDVIGFVGTTGNAAPDAPHLHFTIYRLPPGKEWWKGTAINPFPYLAR